MATPKTIAKGFICSKCKQQHAFSVYVFAHWTINLTHTCSCGQQHRIFQGKAFIIGPNPTDA